MIDSSNSQYPNSNDKNSVKSYPYRIEKGSNI